MTRRDFQLVGSVLRRAALDPGCDRETVATLAGSFAVELSKTNERFDSARFLALALPPEPTPAMTDAELRRQIEAATAA